MFTPASDASGEVDVKVIEEKDFKYWDEHVNNESVYYIVDPCQTKDNCNLHVNFKGKVIIVASPDDRHWGESDFNKGRGVDNSKEIGGTGGTFLYYPVWTLSELIASSSYLTAKCHLDESEIRARFGRFGGVPRYVFATDISSCESKQIQCLEMINDEAAISLAHKNRSAIRSSSKDLPKGMLLSYILSPEENQTYKTGFAVFSSEYVYNWIVDKFKFQLWKEMVRDELSFDPYLYEAYVRKLFYDNAVPNVKKKYNVMNCVGKKGNRVHPAESLGGCAEARKVDDIMKSAAEISNIVFYPSSTNYKLIDFIYSSDCTTFNCFQCTISNTHDAQQSFIFDLVNTLMKIRKNKKILPRIQLFYCVPKGKFSDFVTNPVNASDEAHMFCKGQVEGTAEIYVKWHDICQSKSCALILPLILTLN